MISLFKADLHQWPLNPITLTVPPEGRWKYCYSYVLPEDTVGRREPDWLHLSFVHPVPDLAFDL